MTDAKVSSVCASQSAQWTLPPSIPSRRVFPDRHTPRSALGGLKGRDVDPGRMGIFVCLLDDRPHLHPTLSALHKHRQNVHSIPLPPDPSTDPPGTLPLDPHNPAMAMSDHLSDGLSSDTPNVPDSTSTARGMAPTTEDGSTELSVGQVGDTKSSDSQVPITVSDILSCTTNPTSPPLIPPTTAPSSVSTEPSSTRPTEIVRPQSTDSDIHRTSPPNQSPILPIKVDHTQPQIQAEALNRARGEWLTWRFTEEEEARRKAYLPLA
ncbi:hypothetical protein IAR55_002690 [Kwoniella newhampshirensis]|uniref:Uncharacterized protein n=1 Tax=Kwoniella newhampshirensis TaxID=1651941 RepID=A0AAW0YPL7_9TREE